MRIRFWIIHLLLVATAVGLAYRLRTAWRVYAAQNGMQSLVLRPVSRVSVPTGASRPDYSSIAQQNPFHPDRNDTIQQATQPVKPTAPPPLVYGSIILEGTRFALLATDESTAPQKVEEGGTFNGYHLTKVLPQSVVFEAAGTESEIMFYNSMTKLRRQSARTPASAAPSSPAAVRSTSTSDGAPGGAPAPTPSVTGSAPPRPASLPPPPAGKKIVDTPFGPIYVDDKRPDKDHQ
jgi:type II secretory pathway component PulC